MAARITEQTAPAKRRFALAVAIRIEVKDDPQYTASILREVEEIAKVVQQDMEAEVEYSFTEDQKVLGAAWKVLEISDES